MAPNQDNYESLEMMAGIFKVVGVIGLLASIAGAFGAYVQYGNQPAVGAVAAFLVIMGGIVNLVSFWAAAALLLAVREIALNTRRTAQLLGPESAPVKHPAAG